MKRQKKIVEKLNLQNHIEHLLKKSKHNPVHFEKAYLVHLSLNRNVAYKLDAPGEGLQNCLKGQK